MRFLLLTLVLLLAGPAWARPFTLDETYALRHPGCLALAPAGDRVAFVVTTADLKTGAWRSHLWMAFADGRPAVQLTRGEADDADPQWSPDGKRLAYLSHRAEGSQIFLLPLGGGEPYAISAFDGDPVDFQWMPDGKRIAYVERDPVPAARAEERAQAESRSAEANVEDEPGRPCHIGILEVEGGATEVLATGDAGVADLEVSPAGDRIVYASNGTGRDDSDDAYNLYLLSTRGGTPKLITSFPGGRARRSYDVDSFRGAAQPRWSPDGKYLTYLMHVDPLLNYSRPDIYLAPLDGRAPRNLSAASDRFVASYLWRGKTLAFSAADGVGEPFFRVADPLSAKPRPERLTGKIGVWDSLTLSADGRVVAGVFEDPAHAPEVWIFRADAPDKGHPVTALNAFTRDWWRPTQRAVTWKSGPYTIEGVLIQPPGKNLPLIVVPHGGPLGHAVMRFSGGLRMTWMAQRGWAFLLPNFRGSDGYGNAFATVNRQDLGGGDYQDIMAGVDAVVAEEWVDSKRLGVMGGSYGGYMTNWIISHSGRFKAAVSMYGMFSLITDFSNSVIPSFETDYLGDYYWENPERYARHSPSTFVTAIHTPLLLLHGEADSNTSLANSREMFTALRKLGRTVEMIRYPREDHGISNEPNHARDVVLRIEAWFARWFAPPTAVRGWTVRVSSVKRLEDGMVEITLLFECPAGDFPTLNIGLQSIRLNGAPPLGVPQDTLGETVLLRGNALTLTTDSSKHSQAVPLRLAFRAPESEARAELTVPNFPTATVEVAPAHGGACEERKTLLPSVRRGDTVR